MINLKEKIFEKEKYFHLSKRQATLLRWGKKHPSDINIQFVKRFFLIAETWIQHIPLDKFRKNEYLMEAIPFWEDLLSEKEGEVFLLFHKRKIVGFSLMVEHNKYFDRKYVVVSPYYQGEGLSKLLLEETFRYCAVCQKGLFVAKYTDEGLQKLDKNNKNLAKKYRVDFFTNVREEFSD